ncbi:MAG: MarR family winged helix-turn-helix transcriptional regulator [Desulfovibrio sp.]|jgi:DNA-binding MarR family transcriptional regulator|nr:MarR family winged helix-turn-helix transcriptional regulator [Desulfovibrio sp.]
MKKTLQSGIVPSDRENVCYCTAVRKAARLLTGFYDMSVAPGGLKITQYSLLNHLLRLGPVTINELSAAVLLERTTLMRNLNLLAKKKFVEILPAPTPKAHSIRLTNLGKEKLAQVQPLWEAAQQKTEALLTSQERLFLRRLASRLSTALSDAVAQT